MRGTRRRWGAKTRGTEKISRSLDALFHGLPDELVDLEGEAGGEAVGEHPVDQKAGVEGGVVGGAKGAGGFGEGGREEDVAGFLFEGVGADEVTGELVVFTAGEDELDLVDGGEGVEVFHAEGAEGGAGAGAFDVDDLVDGFGDVGQGALAGGLDHEGEVAIEKGLHEGEEVAGLEHGLAAGELDQGAGAEGLDVGEDLVVGEGFATGEGVLGVAPGAAEVAAGEPDEDAGEAGEGGLALDGFVELDEVHAGCGNAGMLSLWAMAGRCDGICCADRSGASHFSLLGSAAGICGVCCPDRSVPRTAFARTYTRREMGLC